MNVLLEKLSPIFSPRFIKFGTVGFSGVFINLGFLLLFADFLHIHTNISSALAIEVSILSNFIINELWTFRDRRDGGGTVWTRAARFNLVSLLGALVQWTIFVSLNGLWVMFIAKPEIADAYFKSWPMDSWKILVYPIINPPDVGNFKYFSQLVGIAVATFWNFLVNFYWTWSLNSSGGQDE